MAPAVLIEVQSAANTSTAAHGLDDVVAGQDHLKDTRDELEVLPGEPDKENAVDVGRSAIEYDPFDSDDSDVDEDNEFQPRGQGTRPLQAAPLQQAFVPTRARGNGDNNAPTVAAPPGVPAEAAPPAAPSEAASRERERVGEGESGRTPQLIASRGTSVPQGR